MSSTPQRPIPNGYHRAPNGLYSSARRGASTTRDATLAPHSNAAIPAVDEEERDEDPLHLLLKQRWLDSEADIAALFRADGLGRRASRDSGSRVEVVEPVEAEVVTKPSSSKAAARTIDDDYGDDDDEEEEDDDEDAVGKESPLKGKTSSAAANGILPFAVRSPLPLTKTTPHRTNTTSSTDNAKTTEDVRKQLEEQKKAAAEATKKSFQAMFYTLEHDRDAMLEQQKLDELDREVENEITGGPNGAQNAQAGANGQGSNGNGQGSLGSADLGASSLTLKHLIARIDAKRDMVQASDNQLRSLISEVRKGRSKWASEDKVGQEELYEAAEKVLMELKAMTEYVQPFLQRVSKREAPDYHNVIKHPMDIGSMLKKLKQLAYKSKKEFVDDLNLIWSNCLKYNSSADHPFRKKALYMRKETDKLTPLIPDVVVRDRAEVEAEERRQHSIDADDSDEDDAPIMASRGRKAPKKGGIGTSTTARKGLGADSEGSVTPVTDVKPVLHQNASNLRNEFLRADSEAQDVSSTGFSTPPPGNSTPLVNGHTGHAAAAAAAGSQGDVMEIDPVGNSTGTSEDLGEDDAEFKTWKQLTMKDRALAAAERSRLFRGDHLNPDEPALLRSKAMMRRWMRQQKLDPSYKLSSDNDATDGASDTEMRIAGETLAEGIETEEDSTLPDYYNPLSSIPDLSEHWKWITDSEGFVAIQSEEFMRMFPRSTFVSTRSSLAQKMDANMKQMQDTRKICSKIGIVKQMQIQGQTYQNQFQKYDPQPFVEQDVGAVVVSEDGPLMAPWVNRAALQRSVGKIFYHAGFEDFQPSALEAATDIASQYFSRLLDGFKTFHEQPTAEAGGVRFSFEERILHTLHEHGLDLEGLEVYVKEDIDRLGTKLGVVHERMKAHYADLLRPALSDNAGQDGAGAFNDGSEQFVGGDFADEMGEDYFGFKELGLAEELGLEALSVPFHLLQNRMHSAYQAQHQGPTVTAGVVFPQPEPYAAITVDTIGNEIGLVQDFFRGRLRANHDGPLVEDEDLPQKQRFPKPRLPPTGKISSPRKRPIREQQQAAKKKRKLEESEEKAKMLKPIGPLRLEMPESRASMAEPEKELEASAAMISPESITGH